MKRASGVTLVLFFLFISLTFLPSAQATDYPTKPIFLILPYPAGGSTDLTTRALAGAAKKYLGQPIIIENKPGGGATVGPTLLLTKPPDGYTIGLITSGVTIAFHMGKLTFNPTQDVTHILRWGGYLFGIMVREEAPWKTIQEFIEDSRKNPEKITYASVGVGTSPHLAMEELALVAGGIRWIHIPSKGGAEASTALLGGHTDMSSNSLASLSPHLKAGKIRGLAISMKTRHPEFPDIPTTGELKYPDVNFVVWLAVFVPTGVPKQVVDTLIPAVEKAFRAPEVIQRGSNAGLIIDYMGPDQTRKLMETGIQVVKRVAAEAGLIK